MDQQQQSRWRIIVRWTLWSGGIAATLALVIGLYGGYRYGWKWTGIGEGANFSKKTLWDWLNLLIIPVVLAAGGVQFNRQQRARELEIEQSRAQDEALQAYLDQIGQLLLDKDLRESHEDDKVRMVARARTLTALARLDPQRKGSLLRFLYESNLINGAHPVVRLGGAGMIESVAGGADLKRIGLSFVYLRGINLSGTDISDADLAFTDLRDCDLSRALLFDAHLEHGNITNANLRYALLSSADLRGTRLENANLEGANLEEANLEEANLEKANLKKANLRWAKLNGANLTEAELDAVDLTEADMTNAIISNEQLAACRPPKGATMPNGQKYQDWLKSREEGGDGG